MPVHDWTRVDARIYHSFHNAWITHLVETLNGGLLPDGYYALAEQHATLGIPDVLTLHVPESPSREPRISSAGGVALAEVPPRVRRRLVPESLAAYRALRKTVTVRHVSGHRVVALLEISSPGNKDRSTSVADFVNKVDEALRRKCHVLLVDILPPGRHDPRGLHGALWERYDSQPYDLPADETLTLASYCAGEIGPEAFVEHLALGQSLPEMPLFLDTGRYVPVPLEETYAAAYRGMPAFYREQLAPLGRSPAFSPVAVVDRVEGSRCQPATSEPCSQIAVPAQEFTNSIGIKFVRIEPGTFLRGSTKEHIKKLLKLYPKANEDWLEWEQPQHEVEITKPFHLGIYPVTQGQYQAVTGRNPSEFEGWDDLPVERITWKAAVAFCERLTAAEGNWVHYRLPTEAEWEYACRAGNTAFFPWGDDPPLLVEHAWCRENAERKTHRVGEKLPNAWGLYDMLGNVWEWCADCNDEMEYQKYRGSTRS